MSNQRFLQEHFTRLAVNEFTTRWNSSQHDREREENMCQRIMSNVNTILRSLYNNDPVNFAYNGQENFWNIFVDVAEQIVSTDCSTDTDADEEAVDVILQCMYACYLLVKLGLAHRTMTSQMFTDRGIDQRSPTLVSLVYPIEDAASIADRSFNFGINADRQITHIAHRRCPQLGFCQSKKNSSSRAFGVEQPDSASIKKLYGTLIQDTVAFDAFTRAERYFGESFCSSDVLIDAFDPYIRSLLQTPQDLRLPCPIFAYDTCRVKDWDPEDPLRGGDHQYTLIMIQSTNNEASYVTLVDFRIESDRKLPLPAGPRPDIYVQSTRLMQQQMNDIKEQLSRMQVQVNTLSAQGQFANAKIQENYVEYSAIRQRELNSVFDALNKPDHVAVKNAISSNIVWPTLTEAEKNAVRAPGNQQVHGPNVLEDAVATILTHTPLNRLTYADVSFRTSYGDFNVQLINMLYHPSLNCPDVFQLPANKPRRIAPWRSYIVQALNAIAWFHQCALLVLKLEGTLYKKMLKLPSNTSLEKRLDTLFSLVPHRNPLHRRTPLHIEVQNIKKEITAFLQALDQAHPDYFREPQKNELPISCQDNKVVFFDHCKPLAVNSKSFFTNLSHFLNLQSSNEKYVISGLGTHLPVFQPDILDYAI